MIRLLIPVSMLDLLFRLILGALLLAGLIYLAQQLSIPPVVYSDHASLHAEAEQIRTCAQNPENMLRVYLNSSQERLNCVINLPTLEKVANYVIQWSCRRTTWIEITAYILGGGSLEEIHDVMLAKGCTQVWP